MSALKPYPAYKPSGVPWLGDIPAHWQVRRLKFVAALVSEKLNRKPVGATYLGLENVESWTGRLVLNSLQEEVESAVGVFRKGDVLFGKLRPYLAKALLAEFDGVCSTEFLVLRPSKNLLDARYLFYSVLSQEFVKLVDSLTYGAKMPRANPDQVGNLHLPLPPLDEQRAIVEFLDRETVQVDALIARKRELLDLLARWRSATITHAVTRGLNPDAPMKPSGVPWLGDIPAHWQVRRLKFVAALVSEKLNRKPVGATYLGLENVESWTGRLVLNSLQEEVESAVGVFRKGDVLFGKLRPYLAKALLAEFDGVCSTEFLVLRPSKSLLDARYLFYSVLSQEFVKLVDSLTYGAKMPRANPDQVGNLHLPLPPLDEQRAIVEHLDGEMARIDRLRGEIEDSIALAQHYRAALISAAVTGRVDVREV